MDHLGIHDKGVSEALKYLIASKLLICGKMANLGKGRSASVYQVAGELELFAKTIMFDEFQHAPLINSLLSSRLHWMETEEAGDTIRRSYGLKSTEILLGIVLYAFADSSGVIEGVGFAELSSLTGLSKTQIRANLIALKDQGYVLTHTAGMIKKGKKGSKSIFQLRIEAGSIKVKKSGVFNSEILRELQYAVLLAHALKVLKGKSIEFIEREEKKILLMVYPIRECLFDVVIKCVDFLWEIREIRGRDFIRMRNLIISIVAELMLVSDLSIIEDDLEGWLKRKKSVENYIKACGKSKKLKNFVICFLAKLVSALYAEAKISLMAKSEKADLPVMTEYTLKFLVLYSFEWYYYEVPDELN